MVTVWTDLFRNQSLFFVFFYANFGSDETTGTRMTFGDDKQGDTLRL